MATVLAHDPEADPTALQHHPMRNALTNVVGPASRTQVHVVEETLAGGELLLLTTDGVHGVLDDRRIERLLRDADELAGDGRRGALARRSHAAAATTAPPSSLDTRRD